MSGHLQELKIIKTKEKSSWAIPKVVAGAYGAGCLRELYITKLKSQFKRRFTKVVVGRAGRLQEWSQASTVPYFCLQIYTNNHAVITKKEAMTCA